MSGHLSFVNNSKTLVCIRRSWEKDQEKMKWRLSPEAFTRDMIYGLPCLHAEKGKCFVRVCEHLCWTRRIICLLFAVKRMSTGN